MKKLISVFLALTLIFSVLSVNAFAWGESNECNGDCEYYPTIIIPGLGQSSVWLVDDNGEFVLDSNGNKTAVFPGIMDIGKIIKTAIIIIEVSELLFSFLLFFFTLFWSSSDSPKIYPK